MEPASMSAVFLRKSCGMERKSLKASTTTALTMVLQVQMFNLISQNFVKIVKPTSTVPAHLMMEVSSAMGLI